MGLISVFSSLSTVQRIKQGDTLPLSLAQITNMIINLPDAKKNLTTDQFEGVYALYKDFKKCDTMIPMNFDSYFEYCLKIIRKFDAIAPYEKYSGGNELEFSFLMDEIRSSDNSQADAEPTVSQKSESAGHENLDITSIINSPYRSLEKKFSITDFSREAARNIIDIIAGIPEVYHELHPKVPNELLEKFNSNISASTAYAKHYVTISGLIETECNCAFAALLSLFTLVEDKEALIESCLPKPYYLLHGADYNEANVGEYASLVENCTTAELRVKSDFMNELVKLIIEHVRPHLRSKIRLSDTQNIAIQKSIISSFSAYFSIHDVYRQFDSQITEQFELLRKSFIYGSDSCEAVYVFKSGLLAPKEKKAQEKMNYVSYVARSYTRQLIRAINHNLSAAVSFGGRKEKRPPDIDYSTLERKCNEIAESIKLLDSAGLRIGSPFIKRLSDVFYDGDQANKTKLAQELLIDYTGFVLTAAHAICEKTQSERLSWGIISAGDYNRFVQKTSSMINERTGVVYAPGSAPFEKDEISILLHRVLELADVIEWKNDSIAEEYYAYVCKGMYSCGVALSFTYRKNKITTNLFDKIEDIYREIECIDCVGFDYFYQIGILTQNEYDQSESFLGDITDEFVSSFGDYLYINMKENTDTIEKILSCVFELGFLDGQSILLKHSNAIPEDQEQETPRATKYSAGSLAKSPEFLAYIQECAHEIRKKPATEEENEAAKRKLEIRKKAEYGKILQKSLELTDDPSEQEQLQSLADEWKDDCCALGLINATLDDQSKTFAEKLQEIDLIFSFY